MRACTLAVFLTALAPPGGGGGSDCELEILLETGGDVTLFLQFGIDDDGKVMLLGSNASGSAIFVVAEPGLVTAVTPSGSGTYDGLAMTRALPSFAVVRHQPSPGVYRMELWPPHPQPSGTVIGSSPTDFSLAFTSIDANEQGSVAFWANVGTQSQILVGPPLTPVHSMPSGGIAALLPPALADDGTVAFKDNAGQILKRTATGLATIVGASTGFTFPVGLPLVSHDGELVFFHGNRGSGNGLFASATTPSGEVVLPLAGEGDDALDPASEILLRDVVTSSSGDTTSIQALFKAAESMEQGLYLGQYTYRSGALTSRCIARITGPESTVDEAVIATLQGQAKLNRVGQFAFSVGLQNGHQAIIRGQIPAPAQPPDLSTGSFAAGWSEFDEPNAIGGATRYPGVPDRYLIQDGRLGSPYWRPDGSDIVPGFDLRGRISYPATVSGEGAPVAPGGPFPLLVIAHGNHPRFAGCPTGPRLSHTSCDPVDRNYRGHEYLQAVLARNGFISVSVDLDDFHELFPGILARAWVVLCHLERMEMLNTTPGPFAGRIDLGRIGLIGHSRGGEAVVQAQRLNVLVGGLYGGPAVGPGNGEGLWAIQAAWSLAPTRFFDGIFDWSQLGGRSPFLPAVPASVLTGSVPFLGMWGDADGDVTGEGGAVNGLHVQAIYDGSPGPKQSVWIEGANHNAWNTTWPTDDALAPRTVPAAHRITATEQRDLAQAYGLAFLRGHLLGETALLDYFRSDAHEVPAVPVAASKVHLQYRAPAGARRVVDDFQTDDALGTTSVGETGVDASTLVGADEIALSGAHSHSPVATQSWYHTTRGILFAWNGTTDYYETVVRVGQRDVSGFQALSFRIGQDARDAASARDLFVRVELHDAAGISASATTCRIPPPRARLDDPLLTKSLLKTMRVPLCDFRMSDSALDLTNVERVRFVFSDRPSGRVAIDDIEFTN